jgi:uncharacterized protein YdiU (UPF0061 family)
MAVAAKKDKQHHREETKKRTRMLTTTNKQSCCVIIKYGYRRCPYRTLTTTTTTTATATNRSSSFVLSKINANNNINININNNYSTNIGSKITSFRRRRRTNIIISTTAQMPFSTKREEEEESKLITSVANKLTSLANHSLCDRLNADPEQKENEPNRKSRRVKSGHYVLVKPQKLQKPSMIMHSKKVLEQIGLSEGDEKSEVFVRFFSGDSECIPEMKTWATPYALSIMGQKHTSNCPFGTGEGYGDGRAISVGEVINKKTNKRYEMQLKGGGQTPFCRGADGRAVLRSSIREFVASEAMDALGVPTTRALSLIRSEGGDFSNRPWYSASVEKEVSKQLSEVTVDDPRLARFDASEREAVVALRVRAQKRDPDTMIQEPNAITTRVAPSFLRVGHFDLFSRRASKPQASALQKQELEMLVRHCYFREFSNDDDDSNWSSTAPIEDVARAVLEKSADGIALCVSEWLRVGFCQGNFNADNCLVAGRTMDYGPFGFLDAYDPAFAKWTGSGEHFAFAAQPQAAIANYYTLCSSLAILLKGKETEGNAFIENFAKTIEKDITNVWAKKLGFREDAPSSSKAASRIFYDDTLQDLLYRHRADWTLFWRELSKVAPLLLKREMSASQAFSTFLDKKVFYKVKFSKDEIDTWTKALDAWIVALRTSGENDSTSSEVVSRMNAVNPKYVPREYMLVQAYEAAEVGDYSVLRDIFKVCCENPYGVGEDDNVIGGSSTYYRLAPEEALSKGGVAFMS